MRRWFTCHRGVVVCVVADMLIGRELLSAVRKLFEDVVSRGFVCSEGEKRNGAKDSLHRAVD